MSEIFIADFVSIIYIFQQPQVMTPTAMQSISQSGANLLAQLPLLIIAAIGLVFALLRFTRHKLVSILTLLASVLILLNAIVSPLLMAWLPFFSYSTPEGQNVQSQINGILVSNYNINLLNSSVFAIATLLYLIAIFIGRGAAAKTAATEKPTPFDVKL